VCSLACTLFILLLCAQHQLQVVQFSLAQPTTITATAAAAGAASSSLLFAHVNCDYQQLGLCGYTERYGPRYLLMEIFCILSVREIFKINAV